jgi:putative effector of murein hydrolase
MNPDRLVSGLEFLATTPLLWLALTLGAYLVAVAVNDRCNKMPLLNPTLIAIALVVVVLTARAHRTNGISTGRSSFTFFLGRQSSRWPYRFIAIPR